MLLHVLALASLAVAHLEDANEPIAAALCLDDAECEKSNLACSLAAIQLRSNVIGAPESSQGGMDIGHGHDKESWGSNFPAGLKNKTDTVMPSVHKPLPATEPRGLSESSLGDEDSRHEERRIDHATSLKQVPKQVQETWGSDISTPVTNQTDTAIPSVHKPPNITESREVTDINSSHSDENFGRVSSSMPTNRTQNHHKSRGSKFSVAVENKTNAAMHSTHKQLHAIEPGTATESSQSGDDTEHRESKVNSATLANRTQNRLQDPRDLNFSTDAENKTDAAVQPLHEPSHVAKSRSQRFEREEGIRHGYSRVNHTTSLNHLKKQLGEAGSSEFSVPGKSESTATAHLISTSPHVTKPGSLNFPHSSDGETNKTVTSREKLQYLGEPHIVNHSNTSENKISTTSQPKRRQRFHRNSKNDTLVTPLPTGQSAKNQTNTSAPPKDKTQLLKDVYALWPAFLPVEDTSLYGHSQICVDWDDVKYHKNLTQGACQEIAVKSGHGFYQYAASGCNMGLCFTLPECRSFKFQNACPAIIYSKPHVIPAEPPWRR